MSQKSVRLTKFAFASRCKASTLKDRGIDGLDEIEDYDRRTIHGAVVTEAFSGSGERLYDTVLVSGGKQGASPKNVLTSRNNIGVAGDSPGFSRSCFKCIRK